MLTALSQVKCKRSSRNGDRRVKPEEFESLCYYNTLQDKALVEIKSGEKTSVDIGRWLKVTKATRTVAEEILALLDRHMSDLRTAVEDPKSEYREGYSYLDKPKITRYFKFVTQARADVEEFLEKNYPQKTRKKRAKDPNKVVERLKFLSEDAELGLRSVDPRDILGASMLTVYNTKTRSLSLFHAKEGGFDLKGCTLLNWDEGKSQVKRLRKPKETVPLFVNIGFALVEPRFAAVKTKATKPNGRINDNCVLLWAKKTSK